MKFKYQEIFRSIKNLQKLLEQLGREYGDRKVFVDHKKITRFDIRQKTIPQKKENVYLSREEFGELGFKVKKFKN